MERSVFDYSAAPSEYESVNDKYPKTLEEAWRRDWENIGNDFRRAVSRFETECLNK